VCIVNDAFAAEQDIRQRYEGLFPVLNEQSLRRFVAIEARSYCRGGVSVMSRITGIARSTISRGVREIAEKRALEAGRQRKRGGGQKTKQAEDSTLLSNLKHLVEPGNARRSHETVALDVEESATPGNGVAGYEPFGFPPRDSRLPARTGIQLAGERQNTGRKRARGSECAVSVHRRSGPRVSGGR
jgi:hypothetical protein